MSVELKQVLLRHDLISNVSVGRTPHIGDGKTSKAFVVRKKSFVEAEDEIKFFQSEVETFET